MPALKPEYEALAKAVTGRLRGDPSLPLDEEPEEEPPAPEDDEEVHWLRKAREACTVFRPNLQRFFRDNNDGTYPMDRKLRA